jgi:phage shock protein E
MKSLSFFLLFCMGTLFQLDGQVPDSVKYMSLRPHDYYDKYLKTDSAVLLDVREFFEFRKSRLKDAVNIPSSGNIELAADSLDKNTSFFLYCYSGGRSSKAARIFYEKGFRKVYNLEGGITAWKKEKMPVVKGRERRAKGRGQNRVTQ